jgi:predicted AAA+ superfamily ATPase
MRRDLEHKLHEWKDSPRRKPLLLKGARQTGKTWLLKSFGESTFKDLAYFNFEEDRNLDQLFEGAIDPARLVRQLSLARGKAIVAGESLIFFDEIQESNRALNALKYFQEEAPQFHIVAAGSLLGILLSRPASFPVGKVDFLELHPLSFSEFLVAAGHAELRQMIEEIRTVEPIPQLFHERFLELLKMYYVTGGMPEPVKVFLEKNDVGGARRIQQDIITSYRLDFAKHVPTSEIPRLNELWRTIPTQLAQENRRFRYRAISERARGREYADALSWLEGAGLILRARRVTVPRYPLAGYEDAESFKVYLLDVGLLGALSELPAEILLQGNRLFTEFHGAFVENYVAQEMAAASAGGLHYWTSEGKAEVDFVHASEGMVFPLEVKAGVNPKSQSLRVYDAKFSPPVLSRTSLLNLRKDGRVINFPLYAISLFPRLAVPGDRT